jgi:Ca2+/H+ antiporter, TMEM165/GDT1 family
MHAFLVTAAVVALAEFGDKTQVLALVLAARFRSPGIILLAILCATLANHALAAAVGSWIASTLGPQVLRSVLGVGFIAMALWTLVPDRHARPPVGLDAAVSHPSSRLRIFGTTLGSFFVVEMGDKTQIATVTLAARYHTLVPVLAGSTLGMLSADAIAVLLGEVAARRLPLTLLRVIAAGTFLLIGVLVLFGVQP